MANNVLLDNNRELIQPILESLGVGAILLDIQEKDYIIYAVNQQTLHLWHRPHIHLIDQNIEDVFSEAFVAELRWHLEQCRQYGAVTQFDHLHEATDDTQYWLRFLMNPIYDGQHVKRVMLILNNISQEKQVENILQHELERFIRLFSVVRSVIIELDLDLNVRLINRAGCDLLGLEEYDVIGKNWCHEFVPPESRTNCQAAFSMLIQGYWEPLRNFEYALIDHQGVVHTLTWSNTLIHDNAGRVTGVLSAGIDISRRRETESQLKESEARYRKLFDSSPNAVLLHADHMVKLVNEKTVQLIGAESSMDIVGLSLQTFFRDKLVDHLNQDEQHFDEVKLKRLDGSLVDVEWISTPIEFKGKAASLVILHDITERRGAEETRRLAHELQIQLEKEREVNLIRNRFISMITHDFKNPLTGIYMAVSNLQAFWDRMDDDWRDKKFISIYNNVQHLNLLVEDITTYASISGGNMKFNPVRGNLVQVVESMMDDIQNSSGSQHHIHLSTPTSSIMMDFDPYLMNRICANLIGNAVKYSPPKSDIHISIDLSDDHVTLAVKDEGIGIPQSHHEKLFKAFERADNARNYKGTGLGLVIVENSVHLHGGTVVCESEENAGTTFRITLPLTQNAARN